MRFINKRNLKGQDLKLAAVVLSATVRDVSYAFRLDVNVADAARSLLGNSGIGIALLDVEANIDSSVAQQVPVVLRLLEFGKRRENR